jgi:hypothetical protein
MKLSLYKNILGKNIKLSEFLVKGKYGGWGNIRRYKHPNN